MTIDESMAVPLTIDQSFRNSDFLNVPEMDPARKIWTDMRRTSRGRYQRRSISASTFSVGDNDYSPTRRMSDDTIDNERNRIMEAALKNKRSVGADTLRSIAPSVASGKKRGTVAALGLGRNWGWSAGWW
jgi:hypothetical protein